MLVPATSPAGLAKECSTVSVNEGSTVSVKEGSTAAAKESSTAAAKEGSTVSVKEGSDVRTLSWINTPFGFARDLLKIVANSCYRHRENQDRVRILGVSNPCISSIHFKKKYVFFKSIFLCVQILTCTKFVIKM